MFIFCKRLANSAYHRQRRVQMSALYSNVIYYYYLYLLRMYMYSAHLNICSFCTWASLIQKFNLLIIKFWTHRRKRSSVRTFAIFETLTFHNIFYTTFHNIIFIKPFPVCVNSFRSLCKLQIRQQSFGDFLWGRHFDFPSKVILMFFACTL
jgi:hypothetical protein